MILLSALLLLSVLGNVYGSFRIPILSAPLNSFPAPTLNNFKAFNQEYFDKVTTYDVWQTPRSFGKERSPFNVIVDSTLNTIILDAYVLLDRGQLTIEMLEIKQIYICTVCYSLKNEDLANYTDLTLTDLTNLGGKTMRQIHAFAVEAIEKKFRFNMTVLEQMLNLSSLRVINDQWPLFVPHIVSAAIKCRADQLGVTVSELAELLNTNNETLYGYNMNQLDDIFFPAFDDLVARKNLFENQTFSVAIAGMTVAEWQSKTMAYYANTISKFSVRHLEILYKWKSAQLFTIKNIMLSSYFSQCISLSTVGSAFDLSKTIFGYQTTLPSCNVAFVLSRFLGEDEVRFNLATITERNILNIVRNASGISSWFNFYQLLFTISEGIWMETPLVSQVQLAQSLSNAQILTYSVPQIAYAIRTLNSSSALSNIMKNNYQQYLSLLLQTYGFSKSGLASLTGQTEAQIDDLTIQEAHSLVFEALYLRYNIVEFLSKFNPAGVDKYVAINLPSFEWYRLVKAAIEKSFDQLSIAFSTNLTVGTGGISVVTLTDGTSSIQVQTCSAPSSFVTTVTCLASCLGTTVSEIYQRTMSGYQTLYQTSAVPLMNNKIVLETEKFEDLLARLGTTLGSIDSETVGETIQNRVGLTAEQLRCMYGWSSEFTSFLFGISWRNVSSFRLCGNFVSWPLHRIALALKYSTPSICDVNECVIHKDDCHSNADCRNTIGSFECTCQAGYTGNGKHCEDIIDCVLPPRQYPCDVRAICRDFPGSFICVCPPGLTLNADQRTCDGSSNPTLSSKINTGVIIGVVAAAVVVLIIVIVIVACFLYRKMMQLRDKEQNSGDVPNLAHEAENQATRTLPPVPYSGSAYEEPAEYAQLEDFGRVSNDENYQGLRRGSEQGGSRNSREDVGLGIENEVDYSESGGEELAEYTQLNSSKRVPIDSNYQGLNMHGEFGVLENSVIVLENVMDQRNTYGKQSCNTTTLTI